MGESMDGLEGWRSLTTIFGEGCGLFVVKGWLLLDLGCGLFDTDSNVKCFGCLAFLTSEDTSYDSKC